MNTVVFIFITIVVILSLFFLETMRKRINFGQYVADAAKRSAFSPTEFHIYDKSTTERCDRLIIVRPFDWYIWAIGEQVYILNPEGSIRCDTGSTSAVKVLKTQFLEVCLKIGYDSLLRGYTEGAMPSKIVPYDIDGTTFTVLSALNLLVKEYVTLADEETPKSGHMIRTLENNDDYNKPGDDRKLNRRFRRAVSAQSVERMMAKYKPDHSLLLQIYRWHVSGDNNEDKFHVFFKK